MKAIVTGADGQLGTDLQQALAGHDVYAVDIEEMDVTDFAEVVRQVVDFGPDVVFHGAAFTDVDGAELNPELAYRVNAVGTQNLAVAAEKVGAALLYVSTDFVFDGRKQEPYHEFDDVAPLSVYGRSKLAGERYARTLCRRHYICRTAWLYGRKGHNFVKTMLRLGQEGRPVRVVDDQVGSPTFTGDLAPKLAEIATSGRFGLYHTVNTGAVSWHGFAAKIFSLAGLEVDLRPIASGEIDRPAARPSFSVLGSISLPAHGIEAMRPWDEALAAFFQVK